MAPRRLSLRVRLTLVYGGLFLVAGLVLLGVTYALFVERFESSTPTVVPADRMRSSGRPNAG